MKQSSSVSTLVRFGVSVERDLVDAFDRWMRSTTYTNRSEAIRDLMREQLVRQRWTEGGTVAGALTIVYDHHRRDLINRILDLQHDFQTCIISTQHVHLDHRHCLEIIAVRGAAGRIKELADRLQALKGVTHTTLAMTIAGDHL